MELSSESELEDVDGLSELDDIKVDDEDINDLDKLIATTRSKHKLNALINLYYFLNN